MKFLRSLIFQVVEIKNYKEVEKNERITTRVNVTCAIDNQIRVK